jgi:tetratricopeptide (TPR) repeat protein
VVDWKGVNVTGQRPSYTLLMSARFDGEKFTYNLNLRDERDGHFVWGQTIRQSIEKIYEEQEAFVRRMASALNIHLTADHLRRLPGQAHLSANHFEKWVQAQKLMYRWRDADDDAAHNLLLSIIRDVPGFGPAHSALAQLTNGRHIVCPGVFREEHATEKALEYAQTALLLDPLDAKAHLSLAWSEALLGRFPKAEAAYRDALQLNENDPWVLTSATHGLAFCQSGDDTRDMVRRMLDLGFTLAPEHLSYLAGIHFLNGEYEACVSASRQVPQGYYGMKTWTIAALSELGEEAAARSEASELYQALVADWRSTDPANRTTAGDWLADMFPIRDSETRSRIRNALAVAGFD